MFVVSYILYVAVYSLSLHLYGVLRASFLVSVCMIILIDCTSWTPKRLCLPLYAVVWTFAVSIVHLLSWKWTSTRSSKLHAWNNHYAQNQECQHPCVCTLTTWDADVSVAWASLGCCWSWCQTWRQAGRWTRAAHSRQPHGNWLGVSARNIKGIQMCIL